MLKIKELEVSSEEILSFQKHEWEKSDFIDYGITIDWVKDKKILLAVEDDETAGVLELTMQAGVMRIESLIVKHEKQRSGIGTALMSKAEKIAKARKIHKIFLHTSRSNRTSKFYKSLGFSITGELRDHHAHQDYRIFTKFL